MKQNEFRVNLFVHADGTLAAHGGDIRGLVIETEGIDQLREELIRIAPRLLRTNHGLSDEEIENSSIHLLLQDVEVDSDRPTRVVHRRAPRILWEDDPRITACA